MRDYLVFVRAGKNSLHGAMLDDDPDRNWDCYVNAWADTSGTTAEQAGVEYYEGSGLNKFEAFSDAYKKTLSTKPYRYVLMIDDDLQFKKGDVSRFFEICERDSLYLTQPAIKLGSNANHTINIRNPACLVRQVNFVEVMAPCFSRAAIDKLVSTFLLSRCTWGIDNAWSYLLKGQQRISVVDEIAMHHTKPMDFARGPFYEMLRSRGIDPELELADVLKRFPFTGPFQAMASGHHYRADFPVTVTDEVVAQMEARKIDIHFARGGTIAGMQAPKKQAETV
jgi:hypothetical protein